MYLYSLERQSFFIDFEKLKDFEDFLMLKPFGKCVRLFGAILNFFKGRLSQADGRLCKAFKDRGFWR